MKSTILSRNYYLNLILSIAFFSVLAFFSKEHIIHPIFKHIVFLLLGITSVYFVPFQLIKSEKSTSYSIELFSKFIFAASASFIALASLISANSVLVFGSVLTFIAGVFTIYLVLGNKNNDLEMKKMFISHFILNFFLLGVVKMFF